MYISYLYLISYIFNFKQKKIHVFHHVMVRIVVLMVVEEPVPNKCSSTQICNKDTDYKCGLVCSCGWNRLWTR